MQSLPRWRARCRDAIEADIGLPMLGDGCPDRRLCSGLREALSLTAGIEDPKMATRLVRELVLSFCCARTGLLTGSMLASKWLDELRAEFGE